MKKFIYITVVLMFMLILIGCVTGASEQRAEETGLASTVGRSTFVGESGMDARGLYRGSMASY